MNLLHHHHGHAPFETPADDRWRLAEEVGELRRRVFVLESANRHLHRENAHLRALAEKRWWHRWLTK